MSLEFQRVELLRELFHTKDDRVSISVGDDCAILEPIHGPLAISVDTSIEGVHFQFAYASLSEIGYRAYVAALSDLAAVGASPHSATVALAFPQSLSDQAFIEIAQGLKQAAQEYSSPIVGGNLSKASELSITATVLGTLSDKPMLRFGARAGDKIWVTGTLGASALGFSAIEKGHAKLAEFSEAVAKWRRPHARIAEGIKARSFATSAIDISDGLIQDLAQLCKSNDLGADIVFEQVPVIAYHHELALALGMSASQMIFSGGEDYELLFTAPDMPSATQSASAFANCIGTMTTQPNEVNVYNAEGQMMQVSHLGFDHFRA